MISEAFREDIGSFDDEQFLRVSQSLNRMSFFSGISTLFVLSKKGITLRVRSIMVAGLLLFGLMGFAIGVVQIYFPFYLRYIGLYFFMMLMLVVYLSKELHKIALVIMSENVKRSAS
jgi:hypothetical protein